MGHLFTSDAGDSYDEVGTEAEDEAEDETPRDELARADPAEYGEQLDDDVEDRAAGDGEKADFEEVVDERMADEGADERRPAVDQAEHEQEAPARARTDRGKRCDDAEALGGVVQAEPDDEQGGERDLAVGCGLADGEAFGEVVKADAERDQDCQALRRTDDAGERSGLGAGEVGDRRRTGAVGEIAGKSRARGQPG